jgi:oligopeptide/dipeptide ABC transporter ATP-binding protein
LRGEIPSPLNPPTGCCFHALCPIAKEKCRHEAPVFRQYRSDHWTTCHYRDEIKSRG